MPVGDYAIDATEVTRSQYAAWLATEPTMDTLPTFCGWKVDHEPSCPWPLGDLKNHPVPCVDWCDAYAYCAWAGKRLCGKIGGGSNGFKDYTLAMRSQWYAACSAGGDRDYPYGDDYEAVTCNGVDAGLDSTAEVGTYPECQSNVPGYEGVFDLSGNLWEWEDSCDGSHGSDDYCRLRGGSFTFSLDGLTCAYDNFNYRNLSSANVTIRCCSD
jgi:formylglycine-generating enzyme required for sulfatase activity